MISQKYAAWTNRVLAQGRVGIGPQESWKIEAYEQYKTKLRAADYPCFFGQTAEARGEMLYTFIDAGHLDEMVGNTQRFVHLLDTPEFERASLTAFFKPDPTLQNHASFVERFWRILQYLHEHDGSPATSRTPDDPLWEFSFEGCEMFVVGTSPTYRLRHSRNLGPGMALIFQPRRLFIDPTTLQPIAAEVRHRIHKRMLAYDGMPVHPDIGFYGDLRNREWKQYALPDDNAPEQGACPFHARLVAPAYAR
jgi:FPC/CPF motif-containing protein YcgG